MTAAATVESPGRAVIGRLAKSPVALVGAFVLTHILVSYQGMVEAGGAFTDVRLYSSWVQEAYSHTAYVGITESWVYPILALVPMLLAGIFGPGHYLLAWLVLVTVLDLIALLFVIGRRSGPLRLTIGWWWTGFLLFLGPISVGRLDSISVPIAIIAVLLLASRPATAALLLTVATWIKVWPAALIVAAVIACRSRVRILVVVVISSAVIIASALALGAGDRVFSFVASQTSRALQVEAPVSNVWMWMAYARVPGSDTHFNMTLFTWEVGGPGAARAAAVITPILGVMILIVAVLGFIAARRRVSTTELLAPLSVALVTAFIAFNKVGSPQYITWIAAPIILGLVTRAVTGAGRSFRFPAVLGLLIAALTQVFYPAQYADLVELQLYVLVDLTVRNVLILVMFGWAVSVLVTLARTPVPLSPRDTGL